MRRISLLIAFMLYSTMAWASSLTLQGGYENTRNNQSDDTWQAVVRLEQPVYGDWSVALEGAHHGRQYFPSVDDPKGDFGSLSGYGGMFDVLFRPEVNERVSPYILGGVGYFLWDFKENPLLQDNQVTVDVDDSVAYKLGVGVDIKLNSRWWLNLETNYFTAEIDKKATDPTGREWHVVGADSNIGNELWNFMVGLKYEF